MQAYSIPALDIPIIQAEEGMLLSYEGFDRVEWVNPTLQEYDDYYACGFYAEAWRNDSTGEVIIAFRGTDFSAPGARWGLDWEHGNIALADGDLEALQWVSAQAFIDMVIADNMGYGVTFTGHSLGGGLAALASVKYGHESYIFAPAPFRETADNWMFIPEGLASQHVDVLEAVMDSYASNGPWPSHVTPQEFDAAIAARDALAASRYDATAGLVHSSLIEGEVLSEYLANPSGFQALMLYLAMSYAGVSSISAFPEGTSIDIGGSPSSILESIARHGIALHALLLSKEELAGILRDNDALRTTILEGLFAPESTATEDSTPGKDMGMVLRALFKDEDFYDRFLTAAGKLQDSGHATPVLDAFMDLLMQKAALQTEDMRTDVHGAFVPLALETGNAVVIGGPDVDSDGTRNDYGRLVSHLKGDAHFRKLLENELVTLGFAVDAEAAKVTSRAILGIASVDDFSGKWALPWTWLAITDGSGIGNVNLSSFEGGSLIFGSHQGDYIVGTANDDFIHGGDGDDFIEGGAGADVIVGGGNAQLGDTVTYASSNAGVTVNLTSASGQSGGHAEGDVLIGIENVIGSDHGDVLIGDQNANTLFGRDGDDFLIGGNGDDRLFGGSGNDSLFGGNGDDYIDGGAGNDMIDTGTSILYGQGDTVMAGAGDDYITIRSFSGTFHGGSGNDTVDATQIPFIAGHSVHVDGGSGYDVLYLDSLSRIVNLDLVGGNRFHLSGGSTFTNFEEVRVGWEYDDLSGEWMAVGGSATLSMHDLFAEGLSGNLPNFDYGYNSQWQAVYTFVHDEATFGNGQSNVIFQAYLGYDIGPLQSVDVFAIIADQGVPANVSVNNGVFTVSVPGLSHVDVDTLPSVISGLIVAYPEGSGMLHLTFGGVILNSYDSAPTEIVTDSFVEAGHDNRVEGVMLEVDQADMGAPVEWSVVSGPADQFMILPDGELRSIGELTFDETGVMEITVQAFDGTVTVTKAFTIFQYVDPWPEQGPDIVGTEGPDVLYGTSEWESIYGLGGDDTIYAVGEWDSLYGGNGNDALYASDLGSDLHGEDGEDILIGGAGYDFLSGGNGDDILIGGGSGDSLWGGAGADVFVYQSVSDSTVHDPDWIEGLENADWIDLTALGALSFDQFANDGSVYVEVQHAPDPWFGGVLGAINVDVDRNGNFDMRIDFWMDDYQTHVSFVGLGDWTL